MGVDDERAVFLEQIAEFAWEIASQMYLPHVRRVAVTRVRALCGAEGATLFLLDPETGELTFELVDGSGGSLEHARLKPGEGIAGRVAAERQPLLVAQTSASRDFAHEFDARSGFVTGSIIAVPLSFGAEVLGVLEAVRGVDRPPFGAADLEVLLKLSPHVAAAVKHAQTEERLRTAKDTLLANNEALEARVQERTAVISRGKREWEATFDAMQDPIAVVDGFRVVRANRAYQRAARDRPWNEIIGQPCHRLLAGLDAPCPGCPLAVAARPTDVQFGESIFHATSYTMPMTATVAAVVVHYRDITEQRALAARLSESERLAAIGQLAAGAAHEINNPLAIVMSLLGLIHDELQDATEPVAEAITGLRPHLKAAEAQEALAQLERLPRRGAEVLGLVGEALGGAKRISEVIRGLGELSRDELTGWEATAPNLVVQRAVSRVLGAGHKAQLDLQAVREVPVPANQLEQAIEHVVRNARQASADDAQVSVRTWDEGLVTIIEIRDQGCGIPADHLPRVFEPFFTTRRVGDGKGLGLAVTWGIVKRHQGDVHLQSEVGKGTTVTLRFRRKKPEDARATLAQPAPARARGVHG